MFRVRLYKNNACALLSRILSILNLDWLQYARTRVVYAECMNQPYPLARRAWLCIYGFFGLILTKNIEMNKRPPLMTLLSALGSYWNEYSTQNWFYITDYKYCLLILFKYGFGRGYDVSESLKAVRISLKKMKFLMNGMWLKSIVFE